MSSSDKDFEYHSQYDPDFEEQKAKAKLERSQSFLKKDGVIFYKAEIEHPRVGGYGVPYVFVSDASSKKLLIKETYVAEENIEERIQDYKREQKNIEEILGFSEFASARTYRMQAKWGDPNVHYACRILMDKLEGVELAKLIQEKSITDAKEFLQLVSAIIYKIAELHEKGWSHGDVTVRNILVDVQTVNGKKDFIVSLVDFGLSHRLEKGTAIKDQAEDVVRLGEVLELYLKLCPDLINDKKLYNRIDGLIRYMLETDAEKRITFKEVVEDFDKICKLYGVRIQDKKPEEKPPVKVVETPKVEIPVTPEIPATAPPSYALDKQDSKSEKVIVPALAEALESKSHELVADLLIKSDKTWKASDYIKAIKFLVKQDTSNMKYIMLENFKANPAYDSALKVIAISCVKEAKSISDIIETVSALDKYSQFNPSQNSYQEKAKAIILEIAKKTPDVPFDPKVYQFLQKNQSVMTFLKVNFAEQYKEVCKSSTPQVVPKAKFGNPE